MKTPHSMKTPWSVSGTPAGAPEAPADPMGAAPALEVRNLWVRDARGRALVCGADLTIGAGELVGLVGESGSGKTLTARSCLGVLPAGLRAQADVLRLAGEDVLGASPSRHARLVGTQAGFIPQNTIAYLHPSMRVRAQIADGFLRWHPEATRAQARARAAELLRAVGIEDPARVLASYPGQLSGGQRQRVNIAMALMGSPRLVVADEPTAALDSLTRSQVADLLAGAVHREGAAMLLVSHDLGLVRRRCDRVLVMYAGRLVEEGSVDAVLDRPGHPYTRALMAAVPRVGMDRQARLTDVAGSLPEGPRDVDTCLFAPRCPLACEACGRALPRAVVSPYDAGHWAACVRAWERMDAGHRGTDCGPGAGEAVR